MDGAAPPVNDAAARNALAALLHLELPAPATLSATPAPVPAAQRPDHLAAPPVAIVNGVPSPRQVFAPIAPAAVGVATPRSGTAKIAIPPPPSPAASAALVVAAPALTSPTAERDAEVERLKAAGFQIVATHDGVVRLRGKITGHDGFTNVLVPPSYHQADPNKASLKLHLHGFQLDGTSIEGSVFAQNDFAAMLAASKSTSALVIPESAGHDATFQAEWVNARGGMANFDTFMNNLTSTMGYTGLGKWTLSTHSGSGWIGDRVVLQSRAGQLITCRAHFDDGYGSSEYRNRVLADEAVLKRGCVYAVANADTAGAAQMDGVYHHRKTGHDPDFTHVTNKDGGSVATYVAEKQRAPSVSIDQLQKMVPGKLTELNVTWPPKTNNHHFGLMRVMPQFWGLEPS
jgi:hypothetical protein